LRLLILVAREGFLKDKCGPRAKKFEHHCLKRFCIPERSGEMRLGFTRVDSFNLTHQFVKKKTKSYLVKNATRKQTIFR